MWTALITGLAALAGALIGGLMTVWATHKTNVATAELERARRLHDYKDKRHERYVEALAVFLGDWEATTLSVRRGTYPNDDAMRNFGSAAAKVELLIPALSPLVEEMLSHDAIHSATVADELELRFRASAAEELQKLEPEA